MELNEVLLGLLGKGTLETLYMTLVSTVFAYLIGIPIGIVLCITDVNGICPNRPVNKVLGVLVNILRSVPFLILLVFLLPFTRVVAGTTIGATATIVPLVVASAPFVGRMVESSLKEVDPGVVQAAESMGSSPTQIIFKVLLPEARPSLLVGGAIAITTILSYSALAGFTGGGGLGSIAVNYGYYKYDTRTMTITVALLVVIVQIFQEVGMAIATKSDRRVKN